MSPSHPDSEEALEEATVSRFRSMGYAVANLYHETFRDTEPSPPAPLPKVEGSKNASLGGYWGRRDSSEVVFTPRLRKAIRKLNPDLPSDAIESAVEQFTRDRSALNPVVANQEIHNLLKNGLPITWKNDDGEDCSDRVKFIDWDLPENNEFFLAQQMWVTGDIYKKRCDLLAFVNGIPLVFIELKKPGVNIRHAYDDNLKDYKANTIPQLWWFNGFIILSNGVESRMGSITGQWEHFGEWKKISSEGEKGVISLDTMIRGTCDPARMLDIIENFVLYAEVKGGLAKVIAKNHQFLGVRAAVAKVMLLAAAQKPLTPSLSQGERVHYRGGYDFSGLLARARELRHKQTPAEMIMWELLRNRHLMGMKFRRQHQIGDYIADFCCDEAKLVLELDGNIHGTVDKRRHDTPRDAYLRALGFTVLRLANTDVLASPDRCLESIASHLPSPSGRGGGGEGNTPSDLRQLGVFWHTQGSGKSYSMVFFAQYVIRKVPGNWTFVVITDRDELDGQIYTTFNHSGMIVDKEAQALSGEHLKTLLTEDHRFVFTLIQKFRTPAPQASESPSPGPVGHPLPLGEGWGEGAGGFPILSLRHDIIVMTDEAHRSQYDSLAMNMRRALPNASFIGFTGTPLMAGEEKTRQVFGDYVSIYNFKQSVDDGATVPLYYENRIPELQLTNKQLNDDMAALLEAAELDEEQEKKLERTFAKEYHLITRDERLETIAQDLVQHFMGRGMMGKAMVVCIDRFTAVRMYDKVRKHWKAYYDNLRKRIEAGEEDQIERAKYMKEADMAVIVSSSQNEQEDFAKKDLNILTHRKRMAKEDLEVKFKDEKDPLRIVFVCAMWITGFDVPSCSTIYLDKPMKNHTLMQTIARANRTFPEKNNGLIVDYVGIFRNLQKALAIYGSDSGGGTKPGETPVHDKKELVAMLKAVISDAEAFCKQRNVDIQAVAAETRVYERTALIADAVEKLIFPDDDKKEFLRKAGLVVRIHKAVMPDPVAHDFDGVRRVLEAIAANLRPDPEEVDISEVMKAVEMLLDQSIATKGYVIRPNTVQAKEGSTDDPHRIDLSKIDFKTLKRHFDKGQKRTVIEKLKAAIEQRLATMVKLNQSRMDYLVKFQEMIAEYNSGSKNIEQFFKQLTEFVRELDDEDRRGIMEGLSDEELALFDILTKPEIKMTEKERASVKKVVQTLLERLRNEKLVLDWKKRQQSRADVRLVIETMLDELPRTYTRTIYAQKCDLVYQHIFESYQDAGHSVYAAAG